MSNDVLSLEDLALKAGVPAERLAEWSKAKLLKPDGFSDEKAPLFAPGSLDRVAHIRRLADLGYGTDEIAKIVKKVGLPREDRGRKKGAEKSTVTSRSGTWPSAPASARGRSSTGRTRASSSPDMRTEGGFRLYSESYVFLCQLIRDLQLFGYTLEEIKAVSGRGPGPIVAIEAGLEPLPPGRGRRSVAAMLDAIAGPRATR